MGQITSLVLDHKLPGWLIWIIYLGKVEATVSSGVKFRIGILSIGTSHIIWGLLCNMPRYHCRYWGYSSEHQSPVLWSFCPVGDRESRSKQVNMKCQIVLGAVMLTKAGCGRQEVSDERGNCYFICEG